MPEIPRDRAPDSSLGLLLDGYEFIGRRARRHRSDIFATRLLLERTICLTGREAAELFYDERRFQRAAAAPAMLKKTLVGEGGVQGLDDVPHKQRKQLFMSLMTPESIERLGRLAAQEWDKSISRMESRAHVVLLDEARETLFRAVCAWSGTPLPEGEVGTRTRELGDLIEGPGSIGLRHWKGRLSRRSAEQWAAGLVRDMRRGGLSAGANQALGAVAHHRDVSGNLLDERTAAVELLNVLRPTVAVAYYVTFMAVALHSYAGITEKLATGDLDPEWVVQEIRRFYPFFPFVAARVREDFEWHGYRFPINTRVLLDLYGTNHDRRLWEEPNEFRPERFRDWGGDPFSLIPQGGGNHESGHRCAGKWVTIELMKVALRMLSSSLQYDVPPQDLRVDLSRMPARPNSGFLIANVRRAG